MRNHCLAALLALAFAAAVPRSRSAAEPNATFTLTASGLPTCAAGGKAYDLKRFDSAFVCLTMGGQRAVFDVVVDSYRAIDIAGSFKGFGSAPGAVGLSVECMDGSSADPTYATSAVKLYAFDDPAKGGRFYVPIYTALIQLDKGKVTSVTFDDGCFFCGEASTACVVNAQAVAGGQPVNEAMHRGCAVPESQCAPQPGGVSADSSSCDMKLFIAWTGTDVNGEYMTSLNRRFSRFRGYGIGLPDVWDKLKSIGTDIADRLGPREEA